ncbi:MAG: adenylate/guanylate cyclase domain-containing protein, partial [Candidatus Riflebacteria bacterium]|nr:adenylate/guanylate cyclase domain-containing protein [Candidatus Riflebacteria bacterium]
TAKDIKKWFHIWNSRMFVISMNDDFFCYTQGGEYKSEKKVEEKNIKFKKYILAQYLKNLGLNKKSQKDNKELLTLSFIEDYFNSIIEENIVPQESVPNRGVLTLKSTDTAVYYLAKDKNKNYYFIESILRDYQYEPYYFFNDYSDKVNSLWFKPKIKYADVDLGVAINCYTGEKRLKFPQTKLSNDEIKDFLFDSIYLGDSNKEKTINNEGSIIKESLILDNDPFSVGVIAKTYHNSYLSFNYKMVFPILLAYTIILLILLTNFISVFIKEPVRIYEKAINELNDNNFGITIKSFSKDEFNNITQAFNEMSVAIKQREQIKRYVSDKLVESVSENKVQEAGEGKQERVTILSSDIRNFTGISEMYEPSAIVEMLNGYFTKMQQAISKNGGIIDKYIGDAIQAVFYDEPGEDNMVVRAAKAALGMRKALEEYNKEREESGLFTIQNGIGIDTDYAITGTIGTERGRKDFSVNGDVIGRAAELEAKTKQTESKILISKSSLKELDCHADKSARNDGLIYRDFDEESVELIDVR